MAQLYPAFLYILPFEDPKGTFLPGRDACPAGVTGPCFAIAGVNSGAFPDEYAAIAALPAEQRRDAVQAFYDKHFWTPMQLGGIVAQDVANRAFDFGVNGGARTAVKILQKAANQLLAVSQQIVVDGGMGPNTLAALNSLDPDSLLASFRAQREQHYRTIADNNPAMAQYLAGWLTRARA